uniref:Aminotransferase-like plant mobile domain-containing protein n=1 Tax=Chenopodium quinoa TaxID=63459 RepID=A0A803N7L7_CHEQI
MWPFFPILGSSRAPFRPFATNSSPDELGLTNDLLNHILCTLENTDICNRKICNGIERLCRSGNVSAITKLLQFSHEKHIFLAPDAYNILLAATSEWQDVELSLVIFKELLVSSKGMSSKSYFNLAKAFAITDDHSKLLNFVREISQLTSHCGALVLNRMIFAFAECRQIEKALKIYDHMKVLECKPDLVTYNTVIGLLGRAGLVDDMLREFASMKKAKIIPDIVTYNTLLNHLQKMGRLDLCLLYMREVDENGLIPDLRTYTALIESFGRSGNIEEALRLFSAMKSRQVRPSIYTYSNTRLSSSLHLQSARNGPRPPIVATYSRRKKRVLEAVITLRHDVTLINQQLTELLAITRRNETGRVNRPHAPNNLFEESYGMFDGLGPSLNQTVENNPDATGGSIKEMLGNRWLWLFFGTRRYARKQGSLAPGGMLGNRFFGTRRLAYNGPTTIANPDLKRGPGRRSTRIRNEMDERPNRVKKACSVCRRPGHNKKTCPTLIGPMEPVIRPGPVDPSVLRLQTSHRSHDVWSGVADRVLSVREHMVSVGRLRVHGPPVIGPPFEGWHDLVEELLGVRPGHDDNGKPFLEGSTLKLTWLRRHFSQMPEGADDLTVQRHSRAYILTLMGSILFADKSGDAVSLYYLPRPRDPPQEDPEAEDEDDILGTQHQRGVDPLACRWLRVHLSCAHTASGLPYYRDAFDHQREDQAHAFADLHVQLSGATETISHLPPETAIPFAIQTMQGFTSFCGQTLSRVGQSHLIQQPRPSTSSSSTVHTMPIRPPPHRGGHSARAFRPPTPSQHTIMTSPPLVHRQYQRNRRRSNTTSGVGVGLDDIPEETAASSSSSPHGKKQRPS